MSRAFVKETDDGFEGLPDKPISEHPNDVTKEGLQQIEAAVTAAQQAHAAAQASGDRAAMATASRELRYWSARRATAPVVPESEDRSQARFGHTVTIVYLTRGERGIEGKSLDEAARIRTAECETACRIIGAKPVFFGQIDGATEVTRAQVDTMQRLLAAQSPDLLFTHWPVDTHMDHHVASMLTTRAWMSLGTPRLYFFEVDTGSQTEGFLPNTYVDVSPVLEQKKRALFAHVSQDGQGIWREHHDVMAQWRGREVGVPAAEAFVHLNRDQSSYLPGL